jgi:hypothetical protein
MGLKNYQAPVLTLAGRYLATLKPADKIEE